MERSDSAELDEHSQEDDTSESWRTHKKHFFILSNAGKPIYSRYGDEHKLAGFAAILQAIMSFVENSGDVIRVIRAGKHQVVFLVKGPLYLVSISATDEPASALEGQLELLHGQVMMILTSAVDRCLLKNPKFDMKPLLAGTENCFSLLVHSFSWDFATFLHAYTSLWMPHSSRKAATAAIEDLYDGLLYGLLLCGPKVVTLFNARKTILHPDDILLLTSVVEREVVHAIEVVPGSKVPRGRIYRMSPAELDELRRQLKELTEKGWIRPSTSPYGAPVLFVPKKGGPLRMCVDYRGLDAITVKNAEPLPRIDDLLDRVQGCRYFTKIDLKSGYHQIAVRPEDQHKTAFQTRYGLYEFVVTPFGLCNAPGTFQHAMNRIFHVYLDKFIVVYLDDILIFSRIVEEHAEHLKIVLGLLRQHQYKVNLDKFEFGRTKILYLGHEISADGLRPEDAKVASIRDWPRHQTVTEVRSFLGMTGYYRPFVKNYSTKASPLTDLTRLDTPWEWTEECEASFKQLKYALTHYEVLKLPDPDKPFVVTADASQYGIGAVLAQQEGPKLRPIEYMSKKMPSKKLAASTYERELYALYRALVHWRHYLLGRFFYVRSDHETLCWIKMQPVLSDTLERWIQVIDMYDYQLDPIKGPYNKVANALSRRADDLGALVTEFGISNDLTRSLVEAYQGDTVMSEIIHKFLQAKDKKTLDEFTMVDGLLFLEKAGFKRLCGDICLILVTAYSDAFYQLKEARLRIERDLRNSGVIQDIVQSYGRGSVRVEDIPYPVPSFRDAFYSGLSSPAFSSTSSFASSSAAFGATLATGLAGSNDTAPPNSVRHMEANNTRQVEANNARQVAANDARQVEANNARQVEANNTRQVASNEADEPVRLEQTAVSALGGPGGLWHFLYRSRFLDQYVSSEFSPPLTTREARKSLFRSYQRVFVSMQGGGGMSSGTKMECRRTEQHFLLAWRTSDFELFAMFDPLAEKEYAVAVCNRICIWVRENECDVFLVSNNGPMTW
ncbi:hypothetical protein CBR_g29308 [Chara braunii]|uniref:Reverse transcriptase domain-containing protein n=1 Tax=Chara braunii TaxID=69332 RepID=A0A388LAB2_CHABU|nr:hypothetical protein CBR_g29308 [Chara braunii]|eukprot:GBG79257.1 hypothetical protein CBR_g29308 [Chara braunii]